MSKKEDSGWFKKDIGIFPLIIVFVIIMSWLPDSDDDKEAEQVKTTAVQKVDVTDYQKDKFSNWALDNLAVTNISYPESSDWQIWINLEYDKYTSKENVENIAKKIGRYYKLQTGYKDLVIVTIWRDGSVYAKGKSY